MSTKEWDSSRNRPTYFTNRQFQLILEATYMFQAEYKNLTPEECAEIGKIEAKIARELNDRDRGAKKNE